MGASDISMNTFLDNPERFADVANHGLFGGYTVIRPELLEEIDSGTKVYGRTAKTRDIVKKLYDKKIVIAVIGIENQTNIHYAMPLKNMWYDLNAYEMQRQEIARQHSKNKDLQGDEWLSKFGKEDKLVPVLTLVVYFGSKRWDGPLTLHSMLNVSPHIKSFLPLCCDYCVNLLEINQIEDWDSYSDDLKIVFGFIKYQKDRNGMKNYIEKNKDLFAAVSRENCIAIREFTKTDVIDLYQEKKEEGTVNMCQAWEDMKLVSKAEGKAEAVLEILTEKDTVTDEVRQFVMAQTDLDILRKWLKLAAGAESVSAFWGMVHK